MKWLTVVWDVMVFGGLGWLTYGLAVRFGFDVASIIAGTLTMGLGLLGALRK